MYEKREHVVRERNSSFIAIKRAASNSQLSTYNRSARAAKVNELWADIKSYGRNRTVCTQFFRSLYFYDHLIV